MEERLSKGIKERITKQPTKKKKINREMGGGEVPVKVNSSCAARAHVNKLFKYLCSSGKQSTNVLVSRIEARK